MKMNMNKKDETTNVNERDEAKNVNKGDEKKMWMKLWVDKGDHCKKIYEY